MSVVTGIGYNIFMFMQANTNSYFKSVKNEIKLLHFQHLLTNDIYKSHKVTRENKKEFYVYQYDENLITYKFQNNQLIRYSGITKDTIDIKKISFNYLKATNDNSNKNLIKNIEITSLIHNKEVPLYVFKNYYSNNINQ